MQTTLEKTAELTAELLQTEQALCRNTWSGVVSVVDANTARACLSGHDSRPLSADYWCVSPNAQYRLMTQREVELAARELV